MIHGTLELWSIIVACSAGVVLGMGFLFPGTLKRDRFIKRAAKDGVKITVGILPVFIVAAFLKGLLPVIIKCIGCSAPLYLFRQAAFIVWYFVIYPIRLQRKLSFQMREEA